MFFFMIVVSRYRCCRSIPNHRCCRIRRAAVERRSTLNSGRGRHLCGQCHRGCGGCARTQIIGGGGGGIIVITMIVRSHAFCGWRLLRSLRLYCIYNVALSYGSLYLLWHGLFLLSRSGSFTCCFCCCCVWLFFTALWCI